MGYPTKYTTPFRPVALISNIINNLSIIATLAIIRARYNSFAKRVAILKNVDIRDSESKYNLIVVVVEKDKKNSDLHLIIKK